MMLHIMNMYDDELLSTSHVFLRHTAIVFPLIRAINKNTVAPVFPRSVQTAPHARSWRPLGESGHVRGTLYRQLCCLLKACAVNQSKGASVKKQVFSNAVRFNRGAHRTGLGTL